MAGFVLRVIALVVLASGAMAQDARPSPAQLRALASELGSLPPAAPLVAPPPPSGGTTERPQGAAPEVVRERLADVSADAFAALAGAPELRVDADGRVVGAPPSFPLQLFADLGLRIIKLDANRDPLGNTVIRAAVAGAASGSATLVLSGDQVTGTIRLPRRIINILPAAGERHRIIEIDPAAIRRVPDDTRRPGRPSAPTPPPERQGSLDGHILEQLRESAPLLPLPQPERQAATTTMTLLMVYTPAARTRLGNITGAISLAVAEANTIFSNSNIDAAVSLVGVEQVNYTENGANMNTVLDALTDGVGDFARIHDVRKALGADLVSVVSATSDACGLAWLNETIDTQFAAFNAKYGTSLVAADVNGACLGSSTLAHEIGHNLGASHDRYVEDNDVPGPTKFAYGYVDTVGEFRDIMSYDDECTDNDLDCEELPYFSNPAILISGRPLGVPDTQPKAANAAKRLGQTAPFAARLSEKLGTSSTPILSVLVTGNGTVTSSPAGINCGTTCSASFSGSTQVTLTATPQARGAFQGWSGACSGTGSCTVSLASSANVTATFVPAERTGPLFSTAQATSQSFLRFYNTGSSAGTVTVSLANGDTGVRLFDWTSPSIPAGAAIQYAIADIESSLPPGTLKPAFYAATVKPGISGFLQHVLWRSADGTLTNLSTCEASSTANPAALFSVHSSTLATDYPSSVAVTNTGTEEMRATLGIFDARNGARLGAYQTPAIPRGGQVVVSVSAMEAAAGITPTSTMYHYVIKPDGAFEGFLQHLVNNQRAGVITDMTTACTFGTVPTQIATVASLMQAPVFSTAQTATQSFLRFANTGTSAGSAQVTLRNFTTGAVVGRWISPSIVPGAAPQYPVETIESALTTTTRPTYYTATVEAQFDGTVQHVLWRRADGTLTNASTCEAGVTAGSGQLANVHTSILNADYPSSVALVNTGGAASTVTLGVFNAGSGGRLGTYVSPSIPAGGQVVVPISTIEGAIGVTPTTSQFHHVLKVESSFRGYLQHLVDNKRAGVITDMSTVCRLPARSVTFTDCSGSQSQCTVGNTGTPVTGQLKRNEDTNFYEVQLTSGTSYVIEVKGSDSNNGTLVSPYIFLYRPNLSLATQGGGGGTGRDLRLTFTPNISGLHYIGVTASTLFGSGGTITAHPSGSFVLTVRPSS